MTALDVRQKIADTIKAKVPALKGAYFHGGDVSSADLKRIAMKTPCILVGCNGADSVDDEDYPDAMNLQWSVGVVCQGTSQQLRDAEALALVQVIAACVIKNPWRSDETGSVRSVRLNNLYNADLDETGLALWEITWNQAVDLEVTSDLALDSFKKFVSTWNIDESTNNATDFVQLEGAN